MGIDPVTLAIISATVSGGGQLMQASYQASVANNNAIIAEQNAERARHEAAVTAQEQDWEARGEIGQFLANAGASGLAVNTGSLLQRKQGLQGLAKRDRERTIYAGEVEATNFENQASSFRAEASAAKTAGLIGVGTSLIGGASKVADIKARSIR